ncbi:MAG: hypothetical protein AABW72_00235 [archaeon]
MRRPLKPLFKKVVSISAKKIAEAARKTAKVSANVWDKTWRSYHKWQKVHYQGELERLMQEQGTDKVKSRVASVYDVYSRIKSELASVNRKLVALQQQRLDLAAVRFKPIAKASIAYKISGLQSRKKQLLREAHGFEEMISDYEKEFNELRAKARKHKREVGVHDKRLLRRRHRYNRALLLNAAAARRALSAKPADEERTSSTA